MGTRSIEVSVGAFVLSAILALAFLVIKVSGISLDTNAEVHTVIARFDDVSGLRERSKDLRNWANGTTCARKQLGSRPRARKQG